MKQIINVTEITEYLYCPRKVFLKRVRQLKQAPNQKMILGMLRHKVFDLFNKGEKILIENIKEKIGEKEIASLYNSLLLSIIKEIIIQNKNLIEKFSISEKEFSNSVRESTNPEINLRIISITSTLNLGFLGKELWRNLHPKYLTEFKLESWELGLRGRIDRVKFDENITPFEIKTRDKVFESDKLQLAAYAMLLEKEFSKKIDKGIVEFLGKQEEVPISDDLKEKVLKIADEIRNLSEENASFPSNFKKCQECSFHEDCSEE